MSDWEDAQKGWEFILSEEFMLAEQCFRQILEREPLYPDALTGMAAIYIRTGDPEQARELCEMATAQAERDLPRTKRHTGWEDENVRPYIRALYYLALTYIAQHAWALAQPALEEIIAWDITGMGGEALDTLAQVFHRIGRLEDALRAYLEAAEYIPEDYYSAGLILCQMGKVREAESFWRRGLERRPRLAMLIANYPQVVPIPRTKQLDREFSRAVSYVHHSSELWDEHSRAELAGYCGRRIASNG